MTDDVFSHRLSDRAARNGAAPRPFPRCAVTPAVLFAASGAPRPLWVALGVVLGAVIASYLGVVAERGWRASADGRSVCVCGRQLAGWENVPVLSWLLLRGRCRTCGCPIPVRYVLTEAGLGAAAGAGAFFGGPLWLLVVLAAGSWVVLAASRAAARRR